MARRRRRSWHPLARRSRRRPPSRRWPRSHRTRSVTDCAASDELGTPRARCDPERANDQAAPIPSLSIAPPTRTRRPSPRAPRCHRTAPDRLLEPGQRFCTASSSCPSAYTPRPTRHRCHPPGLRQPPSLPVAEGRHCFRSSPPALPPLPASFGPAAFQLVPCFTKTHAAPLPLASPGAPTSDRRAVRGQRHLATKLARSAFSGPGEMRHLLPAEYPTA